MGPSDRDAPEAEQTIRTVSQPGGEQVLVRRFRLTVVDGPGAGATLLSDGERAVVGTGEGCDLVLQDPTASRFHAEVAVGEGRAVVRDLGSRNGTRVEGVRVEHAYLEPGARLTLGSTALRFDLGAEEIEVPTAPGESFGVMVGRSAALRAAFHQLARAAATDATVLLEGETGTGKDLAAESLHLQGARRDGPFVVVDCGAIPPALLESELFGHEKGAFTGAVTAREGAFEAASGGTICLREIGELALDLQPKLLRVIERREAKRVGGKRPVPVDVRIVAATNRNLRAEVNANRFRSDLFYRLAVVEIRLPPLRERSEDLPLLVERILDDLGAAGRPEAVRLGSADFLRSLSGHSWPGNVRELRNYLERCLALGTDAPVSPAPPGSGLPAIDVRRPLKDARQVWLEHFEHRYLEQVLAAHGDNVSAAARAAGVTRIHLHRLLSRYGLR